MLLNLSNHPSTKWTAKQKSTALKKYKKITDMAFPVIAPTASKKAVKQLTKKYLKKIQAHKPDAVHIMGEMTFTFRLVKMLKKAGIKCIASTTNRIVEEKEGKKIVQFQFVQFRAY